MDTYTNKEQEDRHSGISRTWRKQQTKKYSNPFADNRPEAAAQGEMQDAINNSARVKQLRTDQASINGGSRIKKSPYPQAEAEGNNAPVQLTKKGAAVGSAVGAAVGSLGFLAGPLVGGITTALATGVGGLLGHLISGSELDNMNAELATHLRAAMGTAKTGGVQAFQTFLNEAAINGSNRSNAQMLLDMVWSLNQVSGFILQCVEGKTLEDAEKIFTSFMATVRNTLGTERQPWGGGNHETFLRNPDYFRIIFSIPVEFLNNNFQNLDQASRMNMLTSTKGWNHQKGPAQLQNDISSEDYAVPAGPVALPPAVVNADDLGKYMDEDFISLTAIPANDAIVVDSQNRRWTVSNASPAGFTITQIA
jgi:hypothetical protein